MTERHMFDMVRDQQPLTLPPETSVKEACRRMHERSVGAVLVTEGGDHLIGIFTGRDAVSRVLAEGRSAKKTPLGDVMTSNPDTMSPNKTAVEALRLMQDGGYQPVPTLERLHLGGRKSFRQVLYGVWQIGGLLRLRKRYRQAHQSAIAAGLESEGVTE